MLWLILLFIMLAYLTQAYAEARREIVDKVLSASSSLFYWTALQIKVNVDNEAILLIYCDTDSFDEQIHTRTVYFIQPKSVTAEGLFGVIQKCLVNLGIHSVDVENCPKLVGIGTDGASANIANAGLKGIIEKKNLTGFIGCGA